MDLDEIVLITPYLSRILYNFKTIYTKEKPSEFTLNLEDAAIQGITQSLYRFIDSMREDASVKKYFKVVPVIGNGIISFFGFRVKGYKAYIGWLTGIDPKITAEIFKRQTLSRVAIYLEGDRIPKGFIYLDKNMGTLDKYFDGIDYKRVEKLFEVRVDPRKMKYLPVHHPNRSEIFEYWLNEFFKVIGRNFGKSASEFLRDAYCAEIKAHQDDNENDNFYRKYKRPKENIIII